MCLSTPLSTQVNHYNSECTSLFEFDCTVHCVQYATNINNNLKQMRLPLKQSYGSGPNLYLISLFGNCFVYSCPKNPQNPVHSHTSIHDSVGFPCVSCLVKWSAPWGGGGQSLFFSVHSPQGLIHGPMMDCPITWDSPCRVSRCWPTHRQAGHTLLYQVINNNQGKTKTAWRMTISHAWTIIPSHASCAACNTHMPLVQ